MSMKVERSSVDQVKKRFEALKKKKEEKTKEYDLTERIQELKEEVKHDRKRWRSNDRNSWSLIFLRKRNFENIEERKGKRRNVNLMKLTNLTIMMTTMTWLRWWDSVVLDLQKNDNKDYDNMISCIFEHCCISKLSLPFPFDTKINVSLNNRDVSCLCPCFRIRKWGKVWMKIKAWKYPKLLCHQNTKLCCLIENLFLSLCASG